MKRILSLICLSFVLLGCGNKGIGSGTDYHKHLAESGKLIEAMDKFAKDGVVVYFDTIPRDTISRDDFLLNIKDKRLYDRYEIVTEENEKENSKETQIIFSEWFNSLGRACFFLYEDRIEFETNYSFMSSSSRAQNDFYNVIKKGFELTNEETVLVIDRSREE